MQIDDRVVESAPRMAATVEIKTGSRTDPELISCRRCCVTAQEALHER